jgi:pimeloyl-ACP methyl ester carboxylesterase
MIYRTEAGDRQIRRRYQEVLDAWPVPAEHLRVPTRQGETFVLTWGPRDAPPLVLLHGAGTNAAMWRADAVEWARHFRVHAVDLIGEPGLSAPSRPLDSEADALWLDDAFDQLGLTRVSIVGASLGGWLALDYATRRADRCHVSPCCARAGSAGRSGAGCCPRCCSSRSGAGDCSGR